MLDEDDGLVFPEEREIISLLVDEHVVERLDGDVLSADDVAWTNRLIELRDFVFMIKELPKNAVLVLAIRH